MQSTYHEIQSPLRWKSSFKKHRIKIYFSIQREECGAICPLEKMMLNLQIHHSWALSKAGPLSWLDQHHYLFLFLLCESLSQEQHMLKIKTGGEDSCNVYSVLPCGIWIRISCSFCCYCCLKINPGTQSGKDKYEQSQQFIHTDLQKNLRSKDHNINLLFSLNIILSILIYCLHTTKDREFYRRKVKNTKSWNSKKATHSSKYNYHLTLFQGQASLS